MLLVIDSNVYIFAFGLLKERSCETLIEFIRDKYPLHTVRISRIIVDEVRAHLTPESFNEFVLFINELMIIDEDSIVPFELGIKYELKEFKPADAFISAYTEWIGADVLVTENRHFLTRDKDMPFKVVTAAQILAEL